MFLLFPDTLDNMQKHVQLSPTEKTDKNVVGVSAALDGPRKQKMRYHLKNCTKFFAEDKEYHSLPHMEALVGSDSQVNLRTSCRAVKRRKMWSSKTNSTRGASTTEEQIRGIS